MVNNHCTCTCCTELFQQDKAIEIEELCACYVFIQRTFAQILFYFYRLLRKSMKFFKRNFSLNNSFGISLLEKLCQTQTLEFFWMQSSIF